MNEVATLFGADNHLVGVATLPSADAPADVACLMLNFGVTQRIGPHRINVKLARRLAAQGVTSFRFDLSGVGDSTRPAVSLEHRQQSVADMKAAMDHIEATYGIRRFAVMGLCSGSVNGYALALEDPRVVGLLIFDAFSFRTRAWDVLRTWRRMLAMPRNPAVMGKVVRWARRFATTLRSQTVDIFSAGQRGITHVEFEQSMERLVARRVAIYFIYTGTLHSVDVDRSQLGLLRKARFLQHVRYEFMGDVDHTVTSLAAQERVLGAACKWVRDVISGEARPRPDGRADKAAPSRGAVSAPESATKRVPV